MDDRQIAVTMQLGNEYTLSCRIISHASDPSAFRLKRKIEAPDRVRYDIPRVLLAVFRCDQIVGVISPDLILIRIAVSAFVGRGRIIAVFIHALWRGRLSCKRGVVCSGAVAKSSRPVPSEEEHTAAACRKDNTIDLRGAIKIWVGRAPLAESRMR